MATGTLYRPHTRNSDGDPVNEAGEVVRVGSDGTLVGQIDGLVLGGPNWRPSNRCADAVDTTGLVGVPVIEPVTPEHNDLLVVDTVKYRIHGGAQWTTRGLIATPPRYRWFTIAAVSN